MDKVTMVKGRDRMIVRLRGVEKLLQQGWERVAVDGQPQALKPEEVPAKKTTRKVK